MHDVRVKFKGKFKDLVPAGFKFQKLFARNYRCYIKSNGPHDVLVWQHLGGYVEIEDLFGMSYLLVNAIVTGTLVTDEFFQVAIDRDKLVLETYVYARHDPMCLYATADYPNTADDKLKFRTQISAHFERWLTVRVDPFITETVRDMYHRGWIEYTQPPTSPGAINGDT